MTAKEQTKSPTDAFDMRLYSLVLKPQIAPSPGALRAVAADINDGPVEMRENRGAA
jgi:hypothetical protein